jgi:hypothetical protein
MLKFCFDYFPERLFHVISSSQQATAEMLPRLGHQQFLPDPFQLINRPIIIHCKVHKLTAS